MPELFKPDIFSSPRPVFVPVATSLAGAVVDVCRAHYRSQVGEPESIEQYGGSEVNSNNFKIGAGGRRFLLKRLPMTADAGVLGRQLELTIALHDRGAAVPAVLGADSSAILVEHGPFHWCLFEFIDGDFYSGSHSELLAAGTAIGVLQRALNETPSELLPPLKWAYQTGDDAEVLELARRRRAEWADHFGAQTAALLAESWDQIERSARELEAAAAQIEAAEVRACHSDLHPHNLLMGAGALRAFIDFESFVLMPVQVALGFACYKLLKQYASSNGLAVGNAQQIGRAGREFCAALGDRVRADAGTLRVMALAEIFRRLLIIFRLNLRSRNTAWNHVLAMHVTGLTEIDVIFGFAR